MTACIRYSKKPIEAALEENLVHRCDRQPFHRAYGTIARMEQLLHLYSLPQDPLHPVVCFDERPCFLIGETVAPLNPRLAKITREHYAYTKNGSCSLLAAIEPLTGVRLAQVHPQRTK